MTLRRLYISDLDGTLLQDDATLSDRSRGILQRLLDHGLLFTVATARSVASFKPILKGLDLTLPVIEFNGAFLTDFSSGEHLLIRDLDAEIAADVVKCVEDAGTTPFLSTHGDGKDRLFCPPPSNPGMEWYLADRIGHSDPRVQRTTDVTEGLADQVVCVTMIGNCEATKAVHDSLVGQWGSALRLYLWEHTHSPGWCWLTIQDRLVNKAAALIELAARVGPDIPVTAFGDQDNDLELLDQADHGIAVENATEALKLRADSVIGPNSADSVPLYIQADFDT